MLELYSNKYHRCFLQYHIAFFTKNNVPLETYEIDFIKNYFKSVSLNHEFKIMGLEFNLNSVILTISCQTTHYIPNLIKALKGGSARFLYKEFPVSKINHGSSLWHTQYIISTESNKFEQIIQHHRESLTR
ncbi:transposase [Bacillus sp. ISL-7]|uniref:transposase n=1 Tax=Bacillus sp. ISL-7 TaxID=2819136 RepID=UPI001BED0E1B|nr:transposase [Bacillus sp. ISL-7]